MALDSAEDIYLYWIARNNGGHYLHNLCRSWNDALDNFHYRQIIDDGSTDSLDRLFSNLQADHEEMPLLDYYLCTEQDLSTRIESFLAQNRVPDNQLKTVAQSFVTTGTNP